MQGRLGKMQGRLGTKLLGVVVAAFAWTAGGVEAPAVAQEQAGTLRVAFSTFGRESLDPGSDSGVSQAQFMNQIFDQLLDFNADGGIGPGVAKEWSISPDGLLYTFELRDDVEFNGGWGMVTAEDVKFSLIRRGSGPLASGAFAKLVEEIVAVDDDTLTIRLNKPAVSFLYELAPHQSTNSMILSKNYLLKDNPDLDMETLSEADFEAEINRQTAIMNELPIGSGPFEFVSRVRGDSMVFRARESHWRNTPAFAELRFILVPEVATQVALLKSGDIDMIQVDADTATDLETSSIPVVSIPSSTAIGWMFNGTDREVGQDKPTANARVRYALNLAINRQELLDVFAGGKGTLPDAPWSMNSSTANMDGAYWTQWFAENLPYDPELAMEILAEEGYPDGFSGVTAFSFARGNAPWLPQMVEAIVGGWRAIGVDMEVQPIDYGAFRPHFVNAEDDDDFNASDGAGMAGGMQFDPSRGMYVWFASDGPLAVMGDAPEFDALWKQIDVTFDADERERLIREASLIGLESWTITPVFNVDTLWALNPDTIDDTSWQAVTGYPYLARVYETIKPR